MNGDGVEPGGPLIGRGRKDYWGVQAITSPFRLERCRARCISTSTPTGHLFSWGGEEGAVMSRPEEQRRNERVRVASRILAAYVYREGWSSGDSETTRNNNRRHRAKEALMMADILIEEVDRS